MAEFALDTSGAVALPQPTHGHIFGTVWEDLSPFAQGYVEALFAGSPELHGDGSDTRDAGFRDLSPEALAMILGDCEVAASILGRNHLTSDGQWFWNGGERRPGFPPLTVSLNDEGKVCLQPAEAAQ